MPRETSAGPVAFTLVALALIVVATLSPFEFAAPSGPLDYLNRFGFSPRTPLDFPRNVALFIPFGCGVASLVERKYRKATFVCTLFAGIAVTTCIESLQIFLPGRTPNVSDMAGNIAGALLGVPGLSIWRQWRAAAARSGESAGPLALPLTASYMLLMLFAGYALVSGMSPHDWDPSYRLILGAGADSQRAWRGVVTDLIILDRSVDDRAAARLLENTVPAGLEDAVVFQRSVLDEPGHHQDIGNLASRVNVHGQFTVAATVSPSDVTQTGHAPFMAVSDADFARANLVLEQDETRLTVRWRSSITGFNSTAPSMRFPNVFETAKPQRIVFSVGGTRASLYTGAKSTDATIHLAPEVVFSALVRQTDCWPVERNSSAYWAYALPMPAMVCLPVPFFLASYLLSRKGLGSRFMVTVAILALPALLVEGLVAAYDHALPRIWPIASGIALTSLGLVAVRALFAVSLQRGSAVAAAERPATASAIPKRF